MDGRAGILPPTSREGGQYVAGAGWEGTSPVVASAELSSCDTPSIQFDLEEGPTGTWTRISLVLTNTRFMSHDVALAGRLVEPPGGRTRPAVVLVHGSTDAAYLDHEPWQWLLPAAGVSVFVFDKRGTGASQGTYTELRSSGRRRERSHCGGAQSRRRSHHPTRLGRIQSGWLGRTARCHQGICRFPRDLLWSRWYPARARQVAACLRAHREGLRARGVKEGGPG